jgi:hypothetical protein
MINCSLNCLKKKREKIFEVFLCLIYEKHILSLRRIFDNIQNCKMDINWRVKYDQQEIKEINDMTHTIYIWLPHIYKYEYNREDDSSLSLNNHWDIHSIEICARKSRIGLFFCCKISVVLRFYYYYYFFSLIYET